MHTLWARIDWGQQIATLRDAVTEDTNLIRFDNNFFRLCRPGDDTFHVMLRPGFGPAAAGVELTIQSRDLYVTHINGRRFERYASTLDQLKPNAGGLDHAVQRLPQASGTELFELQSLLVFYVAESLRSDRIATAIEQMIRSTYGGLLGVPPLLPTGALLQQARCWGQASDAVHRVLSPEARAIVRPLRATLTTAQRQFSERVDMTRIDPALHEAVRGIRTLKRPAQ